MGFLLKTHFVKVRHKTIISQWCDFSLTTGRLASTYPLHEKIFIGDAKEASPLVKGSNVDIQDHHGNTPLHLAVMQGHRECVDLLLKQNAKVKIKNLDGWSSLDEAVSYGDRPTISTLVKNLGMQSRQENLARRPAMIRGLQSIEDFFLEFDWEFKTWVPFVSKKLPSDNCRLYKKGACIRMDTTLAGLRDDQRWQRGDMTTLFYGSLGPSQSMAVLDNELKVFQRVPDESSDAEKDHLVDILMSSALNFATLSTSQAHFTPIQKGFLSKSKRVGNFDSQFYSIDDVFVYNKERSEHLPEKESDRLKMVMELLDNKSGKRPLRDSLPPPHLTNVTWEDYIGAQPGHAPVLGRAMRIKEVKVPFKANIAMSQDFPLTTPALLDVLDIIAPFRHFHKLIDFLHTKLPPGFPIKLEIPVASALTSTVEFIDFSWEQFVDDDDFRIPHDYKEVYNHFFFSQDGRSNIHFVSKG